MLGLGCGVSSLAVLARRGGAAPPPPSAPISAVAADGWQATMAAPADLAFVPVEMTAAGYSAALAPITFPHTLYTTKRVRQPWPDQATLTPDTVALNDFVYASDAIAGVSTAACPASPKPMAHCLTTDYCLVGNAITIEVSAWHRDGVAGVRFLAGDGVTSIAPVVVSAPVVSPQAGDRHAVIVWRAVLDVSPLADPADITVNYEVYPARGGAASVYRSADLTVAAADRRLASPRVFRRDTARFAAPYYVAIAPTGNDAAGVATVSTDPLAAEANPCLTVPGALNRAAAAMTGLGQPLGGVRIRLPNGSTAWSGNAPAAITTTLAEVVFEPATGVTRAQAVLDIGAVAFGLRVDYARFQGITINRSGNLGSPIRALAGRHVVFDGCDIRLNNNLAAWGSTAGTGVYYTGGCAIAGIGNASASIFKAASSVEQRLWRGVTLPVNDTAPATPTPVECWQVHGCELANIASDNAAGRGQSGRIMAGNRLMRMQSAAGPLILFSDGGAIDGAVLANTVCEYSGAAAASALSFSADAAPASTSHAILLHNSFAGFDLNGRWNVFYNETSGTARSHTLMRVSGNIAVSLNTKHDIFAGANLALPDASTRTGGWSFLNGVGCGANFTQYRDAGGGSFAQEYPGQGSLIGTSNTGAGQDPLYTVPAAAAAGPTAGAGGGTYTLQAGSPARGLVTVKPWTPPFDLAGAGRGGVAAAGAYR